MTAVVETKLQRWLSQAKRIVILCIGSEIRTDDAFGLVLARRLQGTVPDYVTVIDAGTVPENYTGTMRRINPTHVLVVDVADMGLMPGELHFLEARNVEEFTVSSHAPSLRVIAKYLTTTTGAKVALLAVQPKSLEFGEALTDELRSAIEFTATMLIHLLKNR